MSAFTAYLETASQQQAPVREADLLLELLLELLLLQANPALLGSVSAALNEELRALPLTAPKSAFSVLMRLNHAL